MASSLSNLTEGIHEIKRKYGHDNENCECGLEYTNVKDDLIEYKWLCCNKNFQSMFDENLRKRFANA